MIRVCGEEISNEISPKTPIRERQVIGRHHQSFDAGATRFQICEMRFPGAIITPDITTFLKALDGDIETTDVSFSRLRLRRRRFAGNGPATPIAPRLSASPLPDLPPDRVLCEILEGVVLVSDTLVLAPISG